MGELPQLAPSEIKHVQRIWKNLPTALFLNLRCRVWLLKPEESVRREVTEPGGATCFKIAILCVLIFE